MLPLSRAPRRALALLSPWTAADDSSGVTTLIPTVRRTSARKHWMGYGLALLAGIAGAAACGGDGGTGTTTPNYTLSLSQAALTIIQGANAPTAVTITRTNFTGAVTLSLGNAPAGVTGAFVPAAPTGTTSTLTVTVGASVTPGTYNLTVDGTGTPGSRSTPLTLTVTAT